MAKKQTNQKTPPPSYSGVYANTKSSSTYDYNLDHSPNYHPRKVADSIQATISSSVQNLQQQQSQTMQIIGEHHLHNPSHHHQHHHHFPIQSSNNPSKTAAIKQQAYNNGIYSNNASKKHVRTKSDQLSYMMQPPPPNNSNNMYISTLKNNFISYNNTSNNNQGFTNSPISQQMMVMMNSNNNVSPQPGANISKKTVDPYFNSSNQQPHHHHVKAKSIALKSSLLEQDHHHHHHQQQQNYYYQQQQQQQQQQKNHSSSGSSYSKILKQFSNLNKIQFSKNETKKPANSQRQEYKVSNTPIKRTTPNLSKNDHIKQASATSLQSKKYPTVVQSDLSSYIEKYKQRVAKAAAKAAGTKISSAANHIPTSIITAVAPSKKGHHKRSISDGVAVLSAFHNDNMSKKQEQRKQQQAQMQQQTHPNPPQYQQHQQPEKKVKPSQPRHTKHQSHTFAKSQEWSYFGNNNQKVVVSQSNTNTYNSPQRYHGGDSYQISTKYDYKNKKAQDDQRLNRYSGNYSDLNALAELQRGSNQQQIKRKFHGGPLGGELPQRCITDQDERVISTSMHNNNNNCFLNNFQEVGQNRQNYTNYQTQMQQQKKLQSQYQELLQSNEHHDRLMALKRQNSALMSARKQQQWISPIQQNDQLFYNKRQQKKGKQQSITQQNSFDKKNCKQNKQSKQITTDRAQKRSKKPNNNIFQDDDDDYYQDDQYSDNNNTHNGQIIFSDHLSDPNTEKQFIIDDDVVDFNNNNDDTTDQIHLLQQQQQQQQQPGKRSIIYPHSGDQGITDGYIDNNNKIQQPKYLHLNQKRYLNNQILMQDSLTPTPPQQHISNYNNQNHLYNHSEQVKYQKNITPTNNSTKWQNSKIQSKAIKQNIINSGKPGHKRHKSDITQTQQYNKYYHQQQQQQQQYDDKKNKGLRASAIVQPNQYQVVGSTSDRNAIKKQNYQMRRTHHYSQSITGAPGGYNPAAEVFMMEHISPSAAAAGAIQTVKKPESLATSISKYQKFLATNSGPSSSIPSHKQSPRLVKNSKNVVDGNEDDVQSVIKDKSPGKGVNSKAPLTKMALKAQNKNSIIEQQQQQKGSSGSKTNSNKSGSAFQRKVSSNQQQATRQYSESTSTTPQSLIPKHQQNDSKQNYVYFKQALSSKNQPIPSKSPSSTTGKRPNQIQQQQPPRAQQVLSPNNTPNKKRPVPSIDIQAADENKNAMKMARLKKQKSHLQQQTVKDQTSSTNMQVPNELTVNMDPLPSQMTLSSYQDADKFTPRTAARLKLIKLIKLSFARKNQPPKTTCDFYRIGKVLGKGAFGKVNLAIHKLSQKMVAIKSINKNYLSEESSMKKKVMHQVNILKLMRHKNVVKLFETLQTNKHIVFVMELCSGGDLLNYVRKRRRLKENYGKFVFRQILQALQHCHSKNILHRDIKLDNVLLDSKGNVKLCDFGVSKLVKRGEKMSQQCGTPAYIAPQILRDQGYYGFGVDSWSAGVVLFAMLYGTVPFKANNMSDLHKLIINAKYTLKQDISTQAQDLIKGLLQQDPKKRLTIAQALKHTWFKDTPQQIDMFTEQEKHFIKRQFTYNDSRRHNRNTNKQTDTNETDPFTQHHLDSMNTGLDKNNTDKSVILAPFNSTMSGDQGIETMLKPTDSVKKVLIKGKIKFRARCREMDKQYEANNNADLDNGVYNKLGESDQQNEKKGEQQDQKTENQLPDGKNNRQISEQNNNNGDKKKNINKKKKKTDDDGGVDGIGKNDSLVSELHQDALESEAELQRLQSLADFDESMKEGNKFKIKLDEKKNLDDGNLMIEMKYLKELQSWGFPREYTIASLQNNEVNHSTTSYYLLAWSSSYYQNISSTSTTPPCHEEDKQ